MKSHLKLFLLLDGFCEVALCVTFKTKRDEFRNSFATDRRPGKFWVGFEVSTLILALGFGVLNKWVAAENAAKTRGSAISEGGVRGKEDIAKPHTKFFTLIVRKYACVNPAG